MVTLASPRAGLSTNAAALVLPAAATLLALMNYSALLAVLTDTLAGLHAGASAQIWVMGSISLGLAAALLAAGSLADDHGRRRLFVIGAALLALSSAACAAAPNAGVFIAGRVVQGAASAALLTTGLGIIGHSFPTGHERARATGLWGAMLGLGIALGPIIAAGLGELGGWRLWYWATLAASALLAVAGAAWLEESRADRRRGLDLAGLVTMTAGVAALLSAITLGRTGWTRPAVVVLFAVSALLLAAFVLAQARGREPMLDLALFRRPLFLLSAVGALVTGLAVIGIMSYLATVMDLALGLTPLTASLVLGIWSGTSFVAALRAHRLPARFSSRHLLATGLLLSALGDLAMLGLSPDAHWWRLVPGLFVAGVGSGLANAMLARLAVESVPADRASMGSGAGSTARYIGASFGVAIVVTIATSGVHAHTADTARALTHGTNLALLVSAALALAGAALAAVIREREVRPALR
ncbi:MFS transporter [Spirillospora sp. NPDC047279]|uniref:MFS transporter n=1 Tax=Spirillospora sp. NPDC047279 TaxID=3155478 RepID=UPI0033DD14A3